MKSENIFRPMVDEMKTAARGAVSEVRGYLGQPSDPELRLYSRLKPDDFHAIRAQYGDNGLLDYIQAMESKRLNG